MCPSTVGELKWPFFIIFLYFIEQMINRENNRQIDKENNRRLNRWLFICTGEILNFFFIKWHHRVSIYTLEAFMSFENIRSVESVLAEYMN